MFAQFFTFIKSLFAFGPAARTPIYGSSDDPFRIPPPSWLSSLPYSYAAFSWGDLFGGGSTPTPKADNWFDRLLDTVDDTVSAAAPALPVLLGVGTQASAPQADARDDRPQVIVVPNAPPAAAAPPPTSWVPAVAIGSGALILTAAIVMSGRRG